MNYDDSLAAIVFSQVYMFRFSPASQLLFRKLLFKWQLDTPICIRIITTSAKHDTFDIPASYDVLCMRMS